MKSLRILLTTAAVLTAATLEWSCTGVDETPAGDGLVLRAATYRTDWVPGADASGRRLRVVNDLGYEIEIETGYLVSYSLSLSPCEVETAGVGLGWLRAARAGHGGPSDPSTLSQSRVEDLLAQGRTELGRVEFPAARYCHVHYLVARADEHTAGLPADVDMSRISLHIAGSWRAPGESERRPFLVRTSQATGTLVHLRELIAAAPQGAIRVTVRRDLKGLFRGVDFARLSEDKREYLILTNLADQTRILVEAE